MTPTIEPTPTQLPAWLHSAVHAGGGGVYLRTIVFRDQAHHFISRKRDFHQGCFQCFRELLEATVVPMLGVMGEQFEASARKQHDAACEGSEKTKAQER